MVFSSTKIITRIQNNEPNNVKQTKLASYFFYGSLQKTMIILVKFQATLVLLIFCLIDTQCEKNAFEISNVVRFARLI